jgi:hypothetical protein
MEQIPVFNREKLKTKETQTNWILYPSPKRRVLNKRTMEDVQNCRSYTNIASSQTHAIDLELPWPREYN